MWRWPHAERRWLAPALWALLALAPARAALESSMALHMLVQLPLLALVGVLLARERALPPQLAAALRGGAAGLILFGFVMGLSMLPRVLDAATQDARYELAKFVLWPLAGAALALSWPRCPPLARVIVHVEVIATLLRFGWGYWASPQRLCASYLIDDQSRTGVWLCALGAAYAVAVTWPALFGRPRRLRGGRQQV